CVLLFEQFYDGHSYVRKVYVTLTNLQEDQETQLDLFYERPKGKDIGYVMDDIRARYGETAILRADSYTDAGITLDRSKKIGGHCACTLSGPSLLRYTRIDVSCKGVKSMQTEQRKGMKPFIQLILSTNIPKLMLTVGLIGTFISTIVSLTIPFFTGKIVDSFA